MAYSFTFYHNLSLVYKKVWESYGDRDSKSAHEYWDTVNTTNVGEYDELQDLRECTDYGISIEQIQALANHYQGRFDEGDDRGKKIAYIAPSQLAFGTGRVYSTLINEKNINFRVFADINEGAEWLVLSTDDLALVLSAEQSPDFIGDS